MKKKEQIQVLFWFILFAVVGGIIGKANPLVGPTILGRSLWPDTKVILIHACIGAFVGIVIGMILVLVQRKPDSDKR